MPSEHAASDTDREELDAWEVHLVYNLMEECPSDECLTVAAPDRETAIEEARRVSNGNPPEVGPVYNERDRVPVGLCDNSERYVEAGVDRSTEVSDDE